MIHALSLAVLAGAVAWLVFVAGLAAFRPQLAHQGLLAMGSTPLIHFGEHGLRALAGLTLILVAGHSRFPHTLTWTGLFIVVSSVLIALAPRRWHHAYARQCAKWLPPAVMRVLSPLPLVLAGLLIWAVIPP